MTSKLLPLLIAAALSGCSMAPDYHQPDSQSEHQGWTEASARQNLETAIPHWRSFMADKHLQELIDAALQNNKDLKQTILKVAQTKAQYRIQDSNRYPGLDVNGAYSRTLTPETATPNNRKQYATSSQLGVGVTSYELDLFGRVKSLSDEAMQSYLASDENRRSAVIALVSQVASAYIKLITDQELLSLTQDTVKAYSQTLELVKTRYDAGYSDALTLAQSKTALYSARANAAKYKLSVAQQKNMLRQLVGAPIGFATKDRLPIEDGKMLAELKVGSSSKLILNRPDILAAEHTLKADNANIGAARAAFFPQIQLTAGAGTMSNSLDDLFSSNSGYWSFAPSITLPIFNWGKTSANLDVAKIKKQSSVIAYEAAIETGFKEVSDALLGQEYYMEQWKAQQANLDANKDYYELAKMRYKQGNDSYIDLLDAQRSFFSARESELSSHLNLLTSRISLFKALGGGWSAADQKSTSVDEAVKSVEEMK